MMYYTWLYAWFGAHAYHLRTFYHARDRVALSTVTALDVAQRMTGRNSSEDTTLCKNEFNSSLVTIVAGQSLPYGKHRMCTQVQPTFVLLVS